MPRRRRASCSDSSGSGSTTRSTGSISLGAEPVWHDTENPLTTGKRLRPARADRRCSRATCSSKRRCRRPPSRRSCSRPAASRSGSPRSAGSSCVRIRGATGPGSTSRRRAAPRRRRRWTEFYGRAMPAPPARIREEDFVPALAALRPLGARLSPTTARRHAGVGLVVGERPGAAHRRASLVRARRRRARAGARPGRGRARGRRHGRRSARASVRDACGLAGRGARRRRGHAHDRRRDRIDASGRALDGVYAAGVDAGGVATGGYASGLAQALVLGLGRSRLKTRSLAAEVRARALVARQRRRRELRHAQSSCRPARSRVPMARRVALAARATRSPTASDEEESLGHAARGSYSVAA